MGSNYQFTFEPNLNGVEYVKRSKVNCYLLTGNTRPREGPGSGWGSVSCSPLCSLFGGAWAGPFCAKLFVVWISANDFVDVIKMMPANAKDISRNMYFFILSLPMPIWLELKRFN